MKRKCLVLLFISLLNFGFGFAQIKANRSKMEDSVLCVVDGIKHRKISQLNPDSLAEIPVHNNGSTAFKICGNEAINGVLEVKTSRFEVNAYQTKLKSFSGAYKQYLEENTTINNPIFYVINDTFIDTSKPKGDNTIYAIQPNNIKKVRFTIEHDDTVGKLILPTLIITTQ